MALLTQTPQSKKQQLFLVNDVLMSDCPFIIMLKTTIFLTALMLFATVKSNISKYHSLTSWVTETMKCEQTYQSGLE